MHLSRALSALLAATALSACASSAAAPSKTATRTPVPESTAAPPLTDAQIARRGLLRPEDFPAQWKTKPRPTQRLKCPAAIAARDASTALANSPQFTTGDNTEAEAASYVFARPTLAHTHYAAMAKRAFATCVMRTFTKLLTKAGYEIGKTSTGPLTLAPAGDERAATRLTVPLSRQGAKADILLDLVVARTGRAVAVELFVDAYTAFDPGFRDRLTAAQVGRLKSAQQR